MIDDLRNLFIIEKGNLIIGRASFHKEMVCNREYVHGGGSFDMDIEANVITFHGESHDFGPATKESIYHAVNKGRVYSNPSCQRSIANKWAFHYRDENGKVTQI